MAKLRLEPAAYDLRAAVQLLLQDVTEGTLSDCGEGDTCIAERVRDRLQHILAMSAPRKEPA